MLKRIILLCALLGALLINIPSNTSRASGENPPNRVFLPLVSIPSYEETTVVPNTNGYWRQLRRAADGQLCAWSFQYHLEVSKDTTAMWQSCIVLRLEGQGNVKVSLWPDPAGYGSTKKFAWWPKAQAGTPQMSILKKDGNWTGFLPVPNGTAGVDFPLGGGERRMEFRLASSDIVTMPLGDIPPGVTPRW